MIISSTTNSFCLIIQKIKVAVRAFELKVVIIALQHEHMDTEGGRYRKFFSLDNLF